MEIHPADRGFAAEIGGLDLCRDISTDTIRSPQDAIDHSAVPVPNHAHPVMSAPGSSARGQAPAGIHDFLLLWQRKSRMSASGLRHGRLTQGLA
jgi:hypothetical protein